MSRPDGWTRNPNRTWTPPPPYVIDPINYRSEVPQNVQKSTIRDGALEVRDAEDDLVLRVGKLSDGTYGLELIEGGLTINQLSGTTLVVKDDDGDTRVIVGQDGDDFDVKVFNDDGESVKLAALAFGQQFDQVIDEESTSSTTYTDLATEGPEVTVTVGPTGRVIVQAGGFVQSTVTNQTALIGLSVDGAAAQDWCGVENNSGGAVGADVIHIEELLDGQSFGTTLDLSEGEHTFKLQYRQTLGGSNADFAFRYILVQPY